MIQSSYGGKNGKLNDTIEVSALWSILIKPKQALPLAKIYCSGWGNDGK